jgi:L-amino acid N-acyltransferase YncA
MPAKIRLATPDDATYVQAIYAPYCFTPISFELQPPSVEEMRGRMSSTRRNGPRPWARVYGCYAIDLV